MSHKFKRLCQWAVIGGFRFQFVKHVERWMAKDIRYARNTESGYNDLTRKQQVFTRIAFSRGFSVGTTRLYAQNMRIYHSKIETNR